MNRNEELITCIIHHLHAQAVTGGQKNSSIGLYYYNQLYHYLPKHRSHLWGKPSHSGNTVLAPRCVTSRGWVTESATTCHSAEALRHWCV